MFWLGKVLLITIEVGGLIKDYRKLLKFSNSCLLSLSLHKCQLSQSVSQHSSQTEAVPGLTRAQLPSELEPVLATDSKEVTVTRSHNERTQHLNVAPSPPARITLIIWKKGCTKHGIIVGKLNTINVLIETQF